MKSSSVKYRIRELIFYEGDLFYDHLYEQIFYSLEEVEKTITYFKKRDKKNNIYLLEHIYVIEVL